MDEQLVYQLAEEYACEWLTQEKVKRYLYLKEKIVLSLKKKSSLLKCGSQLSRSVEIRILPPGFETISSGISI